MTIDWRNKNLRNGMKVEKKVERSMEEKFDMLTHSDVYHHASCKRCLSRFVFCANGPSDFWFITVGYGSSAEMIEGREDREGLKVWECPECNTVLYIEQDNDGNWEGTEFFTTI